MSVRQIERLASSLRGGFVDLIQQILTEHRGESLTSQWSALTATLNEADKGEEETPPTTTTPGRPRRIVSLPQGLVIRREVLPNGYALRFTGSEARRKGLMDDVMDTIERLFMPN
jgi:hypothetical protein